MGIRVAVSPVLGSSVWMRCSWGAAWTWCLGGGRGGVVDVFEDGAWHILPPFFLWLSMMWIRIVDNVYVSMYVVQKRKIKNCTSWSIWILDHLYINYLSNQLWTILAKKTYPSRLSCNYSSDPIREFGITQ